TLAVAGGKLPAPDESITEARAKLDERANQIRNLIETLDLLYDAFGQKRFGKEWETELVGMQKWLKREDRRAALALVREGLTTESRSTEKTKPESPFLKSRTFSACCLLCGPYDSVVNLLFEVGHGVCVS